MNKLIKSFLIIFAIVLFTGTVTAQSPSPSSEAPVDEVSDLTFPIAELGSCSDYKSCLTYCDDPVNNASCMEYAKQKGFYRDDPVIAPTETFLDNAEEALGCDSQSSCLEFCSNEENFDKCDEFAKSEEFIGGYVEEPDKPEYLEKAKEILGCDSAQNCANFCDDAANASKCDEFADSVGIFGGQTQVGPGGCTSNETCDNFCRDPNNFSFCSVYSPPNQTFNGPGGCNSPEGCRSHCEENPQDCRSYAPGSNGVYVPASCPAGQFFGPGGTCTANEKTQEAGSCAQGGKFWNGSSCQNQPPSGIHPTVGGAFYQPRPEMGNCKTPGECYDFCKANPGKCGGFDPSSEKPRDEYVPTLYYTPGTEVKFSAKSEMGNCDSPGSCYDYCKANPGKCGGFDSKAPRPLDTYAPGTYYTPPSNYTYFTPPSTSFYVTPIYYTPPEGSNYTTPQYYTPGTYTTPTYYTPAAGSNYTTPNYYTPGNYYVTPSGNYPTPSYPTPRYYTPPEGSNYTTPQYYTPPTYTTPYYPTPPEGSNYTTPTYTTPAAYTTPTYYTPYSGGTYTTPVYYTPPAGSNYTTPTYPSPSYYYPTPSGSYSYPTPGGNYPTPTSVYYYPTPGSGYTYPTPCSGCANNGSYSYPTPSGSYPYPTPNVSYSYPTPGDSGYIYPSPSAYSYPSPSYGSPSYGSPSYGTPEPYGTPSYGTPSYGTPEPYGTPSYGTPSYGTPGTYATPGSVGGASTEASLWQKIKNWLGL